MSNILDHMRFQNIESEVRELRAEIGKVREELDCLAKAVGVGIVKAVGAEPDPGRDLLGERIGFLEAENKRLREQLEEAPTHEDCRAAQALRWLVYAIDANCPNDWHHELEHACQIAGVSFKKALAEGAALFAKDPIE